MFTSYNSHGSTNPSSSTPPNYQFSPVLNDQIQQYDNYEDIFDNTFPSMIEQPSNKDSNYNYMDFTSYLEDEQTPILQGIVRPSNCVDSSNGSIDTICLPRPTNYYVDDHFIAERAFGRSKIAFRMQTDLEIVDDGFRWRKYGKKKVKSSPHPRNYYRCWVVGCNVKKRVERDADDSRYVITTYEGTHDHENFPSMRYSTAHAIEWNFQST